MVFDILLLKFATFILMYPPTTIKFISGLGDCEPKARVATIMFTRVVIIGLVNTIQGVPTTLVVDVNSAELQLRFLPIETPPDPLPKFVTDPINIPLLTMFVLGATIVSTPMVVMTTLGDWVNSF